MVRIPPEEMLAEQMAQTAILIQDAPFVLVLFRKQGGGSDGAGGVRAGQTVELPPQTVYLSGLPAEGSFTNDAQGDSWMSVYVIVGMPPNDLGYQANDIKKNDWFFVDGQQYKVAAIHPDQSYQIKGRVEVTSGGN